jgi:hypothetical protein
VFWTSSAGYRAAVEAAGLGAKADERATNERLVVGVFVSGVVGRAFALPAPQACFKRKVGMLREALDAFVQGDAWRAQRVLEPDRTVDAYNAQIFRDLLADMTENPKNAHRATRVQSIAKSIERIGDHATNVAEMVVFMVKGEDIRHHGILEGPLEIFSPQSRFPSGFRVDARSRGTGGRD